jgi:hypothetical protein
MDLNSLLFRRKVRYAAISTPAPGGVFVRNRTFTFIEVPGYMETRENECGFICSAEFTGRSLENPWIRTSVAEYRLKVNGEPIYKPYKEPPFHWDIGKGWMFGLGYPAMPMPPFFSAGRSSVHQVSNRSFPDIYIGPSSRVQVEVDLLWPWRFCFLHGCVTMAIFYLSDIEDATRFECIPVSEGVQA